MEIGLIDKLAAAWMASVRHFEKANRVDGEDFIPEGDDPPTYRTWVCDTAAILTAWPTKSEPFNFEYRSGVIEKDISRTPTYTHYEFVALMDDHTWLIKADQFRDAVQIWAKKDGKAVLPAFSEEEYARAHRPATDGEFQMIELRRRLALDRCRNQDDVKYNRQVDWRALPEQDDFSDAA